MTTGRGHFTAPDPDGAGMKPGFLMIVMMPLENGQMSAALVNTESLEVCGRRAKAIRTVLTDQEIPIKDFVCRSSRPFSHGAESTHAIEQNGRRGCPRRPSHPLSRRLEEALCAAVEGTTACWAERTR